MLTSKTSYQVILLVHILYMLLLLQVHTNNFFCDLNFLYEYLRVLEFREDLFFASRYFRDSFTIAKNAKLKTREIKYPPNLVPISLSYLSL